MHIQNPFMPIQYQGTLFMHQTLKGWLVFLHCWVDFLINFKLLEFDKVSILHRLSIEIGLCFSNCSKLFSNETLKIANKFPNKFSTNQGENEDKGFAVVRF